MNTHAEHRQRRRKGIILAGGTGTRLYPVTRVASHGRYVTFQFAEVAVPKDLFRNILRMSPTWAGETGGKVKNDGKSVSE